MYDYRLPRGRLSAPPRASSRYGTMEDCSTYLGLLLTHVLPRTLPMLTHYAHDLLTNVEYQESFTVSKVLEYLYIYQRSTAEYNKFNRPFNSSLWEGSAWVPSAWVPQTTHAPACRSRRKHPLAYHSTINRYNVLLLSVVWFQIAGNADTKDIQLNRAKVITNNCILYVEAVGYAQNLSVLLLTCRQTYTTHYIRSG